MTCYSPLVGWKNPAGGWSTKEREAVNGVPMTVPCGRCIGCRLDRSRDWATRLHHEASLHPHNSFLTLTFSDDQLPNSFSVSTEDTQKFMKRLRKKVGKVRYFACGEYGAAPNYRPHYHLLVFGYDFPDKYLWRKSPTGHLLYRSEMLEKLWPFGHSEIGSVTYESAGYVARYLTKKISGPIAQEHYSRVHPMTGEVVQVKPEFICMSTKPGIGAHWYEQFAGDAFPSDFLIINGKKVPVPRYYCKKLGEEALAEIKDKRAEKAEANAHNNTPERLLVREEVQHLRATKLLRGMESKQ